MKSVRIFVSSPSDVEHERLRVERVAERLNGELHHAVRFDVYRWDKGQYYTAASTFQAQIPETPSFDVVIGILGHKLGSEMPRDWPKMPDGKPYPSGTAYELLTAIEASLRQQVPDVYIFKKQGGPALPDNEDDEREVLQQWERLKSFWREFIHSRQEGFKAGFEGYGNVDELDRKLEGLLRNWLERKGDLGRAVAWPIELKGSPFRGLAAFGAKHAPVFFGRSRDITRAIDALKDTSGRGHPFLLLIGPSGSGKSSLARAGLGPRLTTPGVVAAVDRWRVAVMRPGEQLGDPLLALATRLFDGPNDIPLDEEGRQFALPELAKSPHKAQDALARALGAGDASSLVWTLDDVAEAVRKHEGYDRPVRADLLLIIDQLDELFAADVTDAQREAFATAVAALVATGRVWVIATLRADLYERFLKQPELFALKANGAAYDVAAPGEAELGEIVRQPAEAAGLTYDADAATGETLDERLLRDVDRPDMLPLLQFTLDFLFEQRETRDGKVCLTRTAYEALGGLSGAIDREAERVISDLGKDEQDRLPRLLRQLAAPAPESGVATKGALTVRSVPLGEAAFDVASGRLVRALIDARILLSEGSEQNAVVRLAHQRVLESWKRAKEIVAANAEFYRIRDDVEDQFDRWQKSGKRSDLLIPKGLPLAEAEDIKKKYPGELPQQALAFITNSGKRARLRQRLGVSALIAVFGIGVVTAGKLKEQANQATEALAELGRRMNYALSKQQLDEQIAAQAAALAEAAIQAQQQFPEAALEGLPGAVFVLVKQGDGTEQALATAWAFAPDKLATAGHVTERIIGSEGDFALVGPDGARFAIRSVTTHPGYAAFKAYKATIGMTREDTFAALDIVNEYDVGMIEIEPSTPLPVTLELASKDRVEALAPGEAVASIGFPLAMQGPGFVTEAAVATLRFGTISGLTDVFMLRASPGESLLIQHSIPLYPGMSGAPLVDRNGKVVGIVSGGNVRADNSRSATATPNAALINFAQRIDLLQELIDGTAEQNLAADKIYWQQAAQHFEQYFAAAAKQFVALTAERYAVGEPTIREIGQGTLRPKRADHYSFALETYKRVLEPGRLYGFIANSKGGIRIALNVKKSDSTEFLRDPKDPRQTAEPEIVPTAWVTVNEATPVDVNVAGMISQPADYVLYVYTWEMPHAPDAPPG
jgi:hypothetical protein